MADLLSKVKIGATVYDLKDAEARGKLVTLLGSQDAYDKLNKALGTAAWETYQNTWSAEEGHTGEIPSVAAVKSYVDAQVGAIHNFDVVVCPKTAAEIPEGAIYKDAEGSVTGTLAASADTMWKLYMVKNSDAGAGAHVEYITVRSGAEGSYTYAWEQIGTTVIDLSGYVPTSRKIADIDLTDDIATSELQTALGLKNLAYADTASGSTTLDTIDSIEMNAVTVAGNATVTTENATAELTRAAYTPSGTVTVTAAENGKVLTGGSIAVTLADAETATAVADVTYDSYTPAGSVSADTTFTALKTAALAEAGSAETEGVVQISGDVSKPDVNLTAATLTVATGLTGGKVASFTEGTFTPNTPTVIDTSKFDGGSAASFTQGDKASLTTSTISYVESGVEVSIAGTTGDDAETLVFTNVTAKSAKAVDTFTANGDDNFTPNTTAAIGSGFYTAGTAAKKEADSFTANELQTASTDTVNNVTGAALAGAPTFTGKKYKVSTTDDTALKTVKFDGTAADIKFKSATYKKQAIDSATFTADKADVTFTGTEVANFQVTGVTYAKAKADAAFSVDVTPTTKTLTRTAKTISVQVSPDAE